MGLGFCRSRRSGSWLVSFPDVVCLFELVDFASVASGRHWRISIRRFCVVVGGFWWRCVIEEMVHFEAEERPSGLIANGGMNTILHRNTCDGFGFFSYILHWAYENFHRGLHQWLKSLIT